MSERKFDERKAHYIVATGIIVNDGKYLIAKRSEKEKAFPGKWTVPGGKLVMDDYAVRKADTSAGQWYNVCEDLVRREVMEEVGLRVKELKYVASLVYVREDGIPTFVISLFGKYCGGEVVLCKDLTDYRWVDLEEAKGYDLIDGIYDEIEMVDKHLKGESLREWGREGVGK